VRNLAWMMLGVFSLLSVAGLAAGPVRLVGLIHAAAAAITGLQLKGLGDRRAFRLVGVVASLAAGVLWADIRTTYGTIALASSEGRQLLTLGLTVVWMLVLPNIFARFPSKATAPRHG
jgi:hypothetical protein